MCQCWKSRIPLFLHVSRSKVISAESGRLCGGNPSSPRISPLSQRWSCTGEQRKCWHMTATKRTPHIHLKPAAASTEKPRAHGARQPNSAHPSTTHDLNSPSSSWHRKCLKSHIQAWFSFSGQAVLSPYWSPPPSPVFPTLLSSRDICGAAWPWHAPWISL